jgi:hypothetical protein
MKPAGWIFMLVAWGAILTSAIWCIRKIIISGEKKKMESGERKEPTEGGPQSE